MESTRDEKREGEEEAENSVGDLGMRVSSSPSWLRTKRLISDAKEKGMIRNAGRLRISNFYLVIFFLGAGRRNIFL